MTNRPRPVLVPVTAARAAAVVAFAVLALPTAGPLACLPAPPQDQPPPATAPSQAAAASRPIPIAVLPLGLTDETRRRYPQLAYKNVGFGIHNLLVERLYDTGRFRFVEDKPEVVEDLLNRQWMASTGAVDATSAVRYGQLLGARFVVYGEVSGFGTRKIKRREAETWISIQVRIVDVETSEYVPASGKGLVTLRKMEVFPLRDDGDFASGTVGLATAAALDEAVPELLERFAGYQAMHAGDRASGEGGGR